MLSILFEFLYWQVTLSSRAVIIGYFPSLSFEVTYAWDAMPPAQETRDIYYRRLSRASGDDSCGNIGRRCLLHCAYTTLCMDRAPAAL